MSDIKWTGEGRAESWARLGRFRLRIQRDGQADERRYRWVIYTFGLRDGHRERDSGESGTWDDARIAAEAAVLAMKKSEEGAHSAARQRASGEVE